jgi:hypothetical protein
VIIFSDKQRKYFYALPVLAPSRWKAIANLDGMRKKYTWVMSYKAIFCLATLGNLFISVLRGFRWSG